ncbi:MULTISPECIES: hypothetical protein [unclassified Salinisphaera]|uniref:CC0125/CC1285 family lipoprotein n=1 Tax=unclassified Salinisphaera TaxID=2649847 RepID=UPI00334179BA
MNIRSSLVVLCSALLLAACASGPAYRAAPTADGYGYRDTQLTADRYRVSFSGDYDMARETVENFALFRAADVALAHGGERFRINSRETSPVTSTYGGGPSTSVGYGWGYPFWGTSIGYSTGASSRTRYETVLEIQIGDEVPAQGPDVYDANQLKHNLAAAVAAGEQR